MQPPLQPLGVLTQPLRYLLVVLGRYHEDVALAELRPQLRALDACIELVALDRLNEQLERAHLELRGGETAEGVAWHQATHGAEDAQPDVAVRVASQASGELLEVLGRDLL